MLCVSVVVMLLAGVTWARIIGDICSIASEVDKVILLQFGLTYPSTTAYRHLLRRQ